MTNRLARADRIAADIDALANTNPDLGTPVGIFFARKQDASACGSY